MVVKMLIMSNVFDVEFENALENQYNVQPISHYLNSKLLLTLSILITELVHS